jgi:5-carboxymethyl-2-hydroxymuconate isomerase
MPHCTIELSSQLLSDPQQILSLAFKALSSSQLFQDKDIKVRLLPYDHFKVGNGDQLFIHASVSILSGRNKEQKNDLSTLLLSEIKSHFNDQTNLVITVDIRDMDSNSYQKETK